MFFLQNMFCGRGVANLYLKKNDIVTYMHVNSCGFCDILCKL